MSPRNAAYQENVNPSAWKAYFDSAMERLRRIDKRTALEIVIGSAIAYYALSIIASIIPSIIASLAVSYIGYKVWDKVTNRDYHYPNGVYGSKEPLVIGAYAVVAETAKLGWLLATSVSRVIGQFIFGNKDKGDTHSDTNGRGHGLSTAGCMDGLGARSNSNPNPNPFTMNVDPAKLAALYAQFYALGQQQPQDSQRDPAASSNWTSAAPRQA